MKIIDKKYDSLFPYKDLSKVVTQYKVNLIKNGTMESAFTKIDHYLIDLFQKYDQDNLGTITLEHLVLFLRRWRL